MTPNQKAVNQFKTAQNQFKTAQKSIKRSAGTIKKKMKKVGIESDNKTTIVMVGILIGCLLCCSGVASIAIPRVTGSNYVTGTVTSVNRCGGGYCSVSVSYTLNEQQYTPTIQSEVKYEVGDSVTLYYAPSSVDTPSDKEPQSMMKYLSIVGSSMCCLAVIALIVTFIMYQSEINKEGKGTGKSISKSIENKFKVNKAIQTQTPAPTPIPMPVSAPETRSHCSQCHKEARDVAHKCLDTHCFEEVKQ